VQGLLLVTAVLAASSNSIANLAAVAPDIQQPSAASQTQTLSCPAWLHPGYLERNAREVIATSSPFELPLINNQAQRVKPLVSCNVPLEMRSRPQGAG
jgi:hypothetical protein